LSGRRYLLSQACQSYSGPCQKIATCRTLLSGQDILDQMTKVCSELSDQGLNESIRSAGRGLEEILRDIEDYKLEKKLKQESSSGQPVSPEQGKAKLAWDLFICHASEDKDVFVRPLATALKEQGLRIWYDEFTLRLGDSLRRKIDEGLAKSRFGVVDSCRTTASGSWCRPKQSRIRAPKTPRSLLATSALILLNAVG